MTKLAFKMKLFPGKMAAYKLRHDNIWPELKELLKKSGISEYSIFLNEKTDELFAVLQVDDVVAYEELPANKVMQKWWAYMADIMESNPDHSPVSTALTEVFYLP